MEFHEKLQALRTEKNLTQEALAEKLYVSRAAVSKWESGRGYPSIDSLKAMAEFFDISIDELIGSEEIVTLAQEDKKAARKQYTTLICGVLDCLSALLFFLPLFGEGDAGQISSVSVFALSGIDTWLKIAFLATLALTVLNGFCTVIISSFNRAQWDRHRVVTGLALTVIGTMLFILTRQPYAGILYLCILVLKGFFVIKNR